MPIGLIHTSWGGTIAEAWVSGATLKAKVPDFASAVAQVETQANVKTTDDYGKRVSDWFAKNDSGVAGGYQAETLDVSAWKTMALPTAWESAGLPDYDGVVWFRKEIILPDSAAGKEATLRLGPIDDNEVTYLNGVEVGATDGYNIDRVYKIPANTLKAGKNVLAVRVMDTGGAGRTVRQARANGAGNLWRNRCAAVRRLAVQRHGKPEICFGLSNAGL